MVDRLSRLVVHLSLQGCSLQYLLLSRQAGTGYLGPQIASALDGGRNWLLVIRFNSSTKQTRQTDTKYC